MNMDRFKRRVWDKERGRMHYGDMDNLMFGLGGMLFWQFAYGSPEPISGDERDNYVSMDCTGLKDSEGTLIYEGDVVEATDKLNKGDRAQVVWKNQGFAWEVIGQRSYIGPFREFKVLGNIYEHPSLLEADEI